MSTEIENVSMGPHSHPDENQLLLALERELSSEEAARIDNHLGSCWSCRARYNEMQRGILAFVEYREKRYLPSLASPPNDFRDFPARLVTTAADGPTAGLVVTILRNLWAGFTSRSQLSWVTATAVVMVAVIVWTQVLSPTPVSANELLTRAVASQNPSVPQASTTVRRQVHQRVRISSGQQTLVRDFEWQIGSPIPGARWALRSEPSAWNAPLTAEGFASWRDSILKKKDKVKRSGDLWTLNTTAVTGPVKEASLVVRANDYHPVEQHILFADDRRLDFEELSFEIRAQREASQPTMTPQIAQNAPAKTPEVAAPPAVDLNETELLLRYTMFTYQWDLGEDLLITRGPLQVFVTGTASSPDRAATMEAVLGSLPNVRLSINAPGTVRQPGTFRPSQAKSVTGSNGPLLENALGRAFPETDDRRAFVDRCLAASDTGLSHAWALKKLVDRYTEPEDRLLSYDSRTRLREMLRTHLQKLALANAEMEPLIELLPGSAVANPGVGVQAFCPYSRKSSSRIR